jgi:hypothetical protein
MTNDRLRKAPLRAGELSRAIRRTSVRDMRDTYLPVSPAEQHRQPTVPLRPVVELAGQGLNIFRQFPGPIDLHLASAHAFETGAVIHVYDRAQRRAAGPVDAASLVAGCSDMRAEVRVAPITAKSHDKGSTQWR